MQAHHATSPLEEKVGIKATSQLDFTGDRVQGVHVANAKLAMRSCSSLLPLVFQGEVGWVSRSSALGFNTHC